MPNDSPNLKEQFDYVRDLVKHEDTLTNFRTTWTLVFQGLLFSTFVGGIGLFEKLRFIDPPFQPILIGETIICILGVFSAVAAHFGVKAAEKQLIITTDWWHVQTKARPDEPFPPVFIHSKSKALFGASIYFIFLASVWLALGALLFVSSCQLTLSQVHPQ